MTEMRDQYNCSLEVSMMQIKSNKKGLINTDTNLADINNDRVIAS